MTRPLVERLALGYLVVISVQIGLWASLAPRSFYDDFPGLGRVWISVDGPYNEHLVRDVGGLNLALAVLLGAAAITLSRRLIVVAAVGALVYGVPHLIYHITSTDELEAVDVVTGLAGLALFAGIPLLLLVWPRGRDRPDVAR